MYGYWVGFGLGVPTEKSKIDEFIMENQSFSLFSKAPQPKNAHIPRSHYTGTIYPRSKEQNGMLRTEPLWTKLHNTSTRTKHQLPFFGMT
jgi:hypothetical protein